MNNSMKAAIRQSAYVHLMIKLNSKRCNLNNLSYSVLKSDVFGGSFNNKEGRKCSEAPQLPVKRLSPAKTDKSKKQQQQQQTNNK